MINKMRIKLAVHQKNIIPFCPGFFDEAMLSLNIGGVKVNDCFILVGLVLFNQVLIFLKREIFSVCIFKKCKFLSTVIELFVA